MKKKFFRILVSLIFITLVILAIFNVYNWIVCGKQSIRISTSSTAYTNSDLYVSVVARENGTDLDTKTKLKLLDSHGKRVKNTKVSYDENNGIISIPDIEPGTYFIEARVSSDAGKDTVQKEIYISNGNNQNVTISLDKGIYKPGDTVNFRALITDKENDKPLSNEATISIYDGNDNKVYNETVISSDYGILSGNFILANEVNSGIYKLVVKTNNSETTKQFKVNPYVTPKYEINLSYDKETYLVGNTANINIDAKYFFGENVSDAKFTIYINDKKYKEITADENGHSSIEYKIETAKTYNLKVEAVDSSNYFVEHTSSFSAGTDLFEVEVLPEYGSLISGKKNNIYVFTKNADGSPLKTYITVSSDNYTKQVATDENGIGIFSIDIDSSNNNSNYSYNANNYRNYSYKQDDKAFNIIAQDMNGNKVTKNLSLEIEQKNLLLSTDKPKYEQGEDIKINVSSISENSNNIYFFKNGKLLKMINTDSDETTINLDDTYGLIDIYVTLNNQYDINADRRYNNKSSYKRTIFITPSKKLNISINTDKQEYKPGENISISFNTTNENNSNIDAALLVSMLDNSVLSLANNDLSIDNIKLALSDIKFSDNLDAATLYSSIINDSQEQTIMALLLKQNGSNIRVSEKTILNDEQKEKSAVTSIILITITASSLLIYLSAKFPKFKNIIKHIINFIILDFIIAFPCITETISSRNAEHIFVPFAILTIIVLSIYILFVSKLIKKTFRTSISIIITILVFTIFRALYDLFYFELMPIVGICAVILLVFSIIAKISDVKQLKINKHIKVITKELIYILVYIVSLIISAVIGYIIASIFNAEILLIPAILMSLYLFNFLFNRIGEEPVEDKFMQRYTFRTSVVLSLAFIGIIALITIMIMIFDNYRGTVNDATLSSDSVKSPSDFSSETTTDSSLSINQGISSILDKSDTSSEDIKSEVETQASETPNNSENSADDNIRNIFLESMCFIPELITTNGNANIDLALSDNITTWTIQTIGNTKDGSIGYGALNNVKVFKEFFVDFELPKNSVVTDKVSIPVTVYNYTDNSISTTLKIKEDEWFSLENNNININISAQSSSMIYVPITILKSGNYKFRVETTNGLLSDIVEKDFSINPKGYKVEKVVSAGNLDDDISEDILILNNIVENTAKAKVKIYSNTMSQTIEGMENIFQMPTGCFEQVSSSLYPNILALKYLEDNKIVNSEIKEKALNYISSGYQKLLTYEVSGESGGYSLYGRSPAETVLTAYGLIEVSDLSKVYNIDNNVIDKMTNFLYKKQHSNGTFEITGNHIGGANSRETLSLNAYITWGLSESNPKDERLQKSVEYLKNKLDDIDDNYTLALVANVLANVEDKELNNVLKRLINNTNVNGNNAYISSNIVDYYGTRSNIQTIQTVALTSIALSKASYNPNTNNLLINYLISQKDARGTWYSTQATILALKALNQANEKAKIDNQTISVKINSDEQKIEIKDNPLDFYEFTFENLNKENKLNIDIQKGNLYYEVIEEYYIPYENVDTSKDNIEISIENNNNLKVNDILNSKIKLINKSDNNISNGMVTISIPQGFTVLENSLMLLQTKGVIEKYETSYTEVHLYLRDFNPNQIINLDVDFRASYPVQITGLTTKAYDYYNPEIEGKTMPIEINVN